ncbi:hypothetical protein [Paraburkholderia lycopersici]|uniref:hypothetical protein n=1 Tax=Paraburkholderia lycopersici TaxID=416944 RepID=UPI000B88C050|nr:hypothetical protein [Paraburkholderia lycopersici]
MAAWKITEWRDITLELIPDARKGRNPSPRSGFRNKASPARTLTLDEFDQMLAELDELKI